MDGALVGAVVADKSFALAGVRRLDQSGQQQQNHRHANANASLSRFCVHVTCTQFAPPLCRLDLFFASVYACLCVCRFENCPLAC